MSHSTALDEAAASAKLEKFHELAAVRGGEISAVDHWGPRQLAYPIKKVSVGYYVVAFHLHCARGSFTGVRASIETR